MNNLMTMEDLLKDANQEKIEKLRLCFNESTLRNIVRNYKMDGMQILIEHFAAEVRTFWDAMYSETLNVCGLEGLTALAMTFPDEIKQNIKLAQGTHQGGSLHIDNKGGDSDIRKTGVGKLIEAFGVINALEWLIKNDYSDWVARLFNYEIYDYPFLTYVWEVCPVSNEMQLLQLLHVYFPRNLHAALCRFLTFDLLRTQKKTVFLDFMLANYPQILKALMSRNLMQYITNNANVGFEWLQKNSFQSIDYCIDRDFSILTQPVVEVRRSIKKIFWDLKWSALVGTLILIWGVSILWHIMCITWHIK